MTITDPGIYDMDADTYHADPCSKPSLSAGMIGDLLQAPAKCWHNSRRLNPDWEGETDAESFTIGTVSHVMFLEPSTFHDKVFVCHFNDWRTKLAREQRDEARAMGKTPILAKHMHAIQMARATFLGNPFTAPAFSNGRYEQSMFWRHPVYGFWCRARPDFIPHTAGHLCDYKATSNADPREFPRHAYNLGYHRRAAWYLEGAEILTGRRPAHYWFVNQEIKPPYLTSVVELDMQAIEAGQAENDRAAAIFARCLDTNDWPGYRHDDAPDQDRAFQVGLPTWALMKIDSREAA